MLQDCRTLESYSDEFLLRALQDRGVILSECSFIGDESDLSKTCEEYGIYTEDEFPAAARTEKSRYPICYCPKHRELLKSKDHHGWCAQHIILPNGDVARCQHTGAFSWEQKRYLCEEHIKDAIQNK